jgi:hypothetical protein
MNNCPGRGPGPRPPWPRSTRVAAVITVMSAALLAAACGGGPSSAGSGGSPTAGGPANSTSTNAQKLLAFSRCMRSHRVPTFPEPNGSGRMPEETPQQLGVSGSQFDAAVRACQNLNPKQPPPALTAQEQQDYLRAAACMRSHGISNFPDPVFSGGGVSFPTPSSSIDISSPEFTRARQTCQRLIPAGLPDSGSESGG